MNSIFYFLLMISGLSMIICMTLDDLRNDILEIINSDDRNLLDSGNHKLILLEGGKLAETNQSIIWKGNYDKSAVAIKFNLDEELFEREVSIFERLNATKNKKIERLGIPRIYYHGKVRMKYNIIAMTLFDGTIQNDTLLKKMGPTYLVILKIFKQSMEALEYIHSKDVVHNDIKPTNLFLSLKHEKMKIIISDFDLASIDGERRTGFTMAFASSNLFDNKTRTAIDDIQSLTFSMWYIADMPGSTHGLDLSESMESDREKAKQELIDKCEFFKNDPHVRSVMEFICKIMTRENSVPDHKQIIDKLGEAISQVSVSVERGDGSDTKSGAQFKWKDKLRRSLRDFRTYSGLDSIAWEIFRSRHNVMPPSPRNGRLESSSSFKK